MAKKKLSQKELKQFNEEYLDFWSRCITETIFWLTPYILIFILGAIIFN